MTIKTLDEKGRLTLGRAFAGRTVQVHEESDRVLLTFCRVVPEREAWLWENDAAFGLVDRGLRDAHAGDLTEGPDLAAAFAFADSIPEDE
jgi:hypothetical protein